MTDDDRRQLKSEALLEFHNAAEDEAMHRAMLDKLVNSFRDILAACDRGELRPDAVPDSQELKQAMSELDQARQRTQAARHQCSELHLNLTALDPDPPPRQRPRGILRG